jgi:hypothetical protein
MLVAELIERLREMPDTARVAVHIEMNINRNQRLGDLAKGCREADIVSVQRDRVTVLIHLDEVEGFQSKEQWERRERHGAKPQCMLGKRRARAENHDEVRR